MPDLWEYRAGINHDVDSQEVDGDTIDCRIDCGFDIDGLGARLRLLAVDCPERNTPGPWFAAKQFTHDWLTEHRDFKGRFFIRTTRNTRDRDKKDSFGRYLVTVYNLVNGDEQGLFCLNAALLDSGNAVVYQ